MYDSNSARISYYRNRNEQQYESYDDDFKGFTKEAKSEEDEYTKEEREKKSFLSFLFRKIGNDQS